MMLSRCQLHYGGGDGSARWVQVTEWLATPVLGPTPEKCCELKLRGLPEVIDTFGVVEL